METVEKRTYLWYNKVSQNRGLHSRREAGADHPEIRSLVGRYGNGCRCPCLLCEPHSVSRRLLYHRYRRAQRVGAFEENCVAASEIAAALTAEVIKESSSEAGKMFGNRNDYGRLLND